MKKHLLLMVCLLMSAAFLLNGCDDSPVPEASSAQNTSAATAAKATEAAVAVTDAPAAEATPAPINTTVDKQFDFKLGKVTVLINDQCGTRVDTNGVLCIGRGSILIPGQDPEGAGQGTSHSLGLVLIAPKDSKQDLEKLRQQVVESAEDRTDFSAGDKGSEVLSGQDCLTAEYTYTWDDAPDAALKNVYNKVYCLNAPNNRGYLVMVVLYEGVTDEEATLLYNIANSIKFYS
jgi:hypothetical protein